MLKWDELSNELQDEELSKILKQSAETVGLYGQDLIMEVKNNTVQAAKLIFLAGEIRKAGGDEDLLTDLLVDYVERIGSADARYGQRKQGGRGTAPAVGHGRR